MVHAAAVLISVAAFLVPQDVRARRVPPPVFEDHVLELRRGSELNYLRFTGHGSFWDNRLQLDDPNQPATRIRYFAEEDGIRFQILVFRGVVDRFATESQREQVPQELVAEFICRPGEPPVEVSRLWAFGLSELALRLVPALSEEVTPFRYDNLTNSVQLVEVEEFQDRLALRLTNNSEKGLIAVGISGSTRSSFPGSVLLAPGAEMEAPIHKKPRPSGEPPPVGLPTIQISCAVFEDYTFEGDPNEAAQFALRRWGNLIGLRKILPVFEELLKNPEPDAVATLEALFGRIQAVDTTPSARDNGQAVQFFSRHFSISPPEVADRLFGAAASSRRFLLDEINWNARRILESERPEGIWDYLQRTLERWQSRLQALREDFGE